MTYRIVTYRNGRARIHRFPSLESARECASAILAETGAIVGIEGDS